MERWNVFGLKRKLGDLDFINYISNYDIVFLSETWIKKDDQTNLEIKGFTSEHIYGKKYSKAKRGRCSGGISVYFKSDLKGHVKIIEKSDQGFLWLKVSKDILSDGEDVYFCNVYFPDAHAKSKRIENETDHFELLENFIIKYRDKGKIFIAGDFNSRCGNLNTDILEFDIFLDAPFDRCFTHSSNRSSSDHVIDSQGRKLIQLCQSTDFYLANGRLEDGDFTYASVRGHSVVDYLLLKNEIYSLLINFEVLPFNEFSDHAPLLITLKGKNMIKEKQKPNLTANEDSIKIHWDVNKTHLLTQTVTESRDILQNLLNNVDTVDIDETTNTLTEFLKSSLQQIMGKKVVHSNRKNYTRTKQPWFDQSCKEEKKSFKIHRNAYMRNKSDVNRQNYVESRTKYNNVKKKALKKYKLEESRRITELAKTKPREFWKSIKSTNKPTHNNESATDINIDDFYEHFSRVFDTNDNAHTNDSDFEANHEDPDLDADISANEISHVIKSCLKNNKSAGLDSLLPEIFKLFNDTLLPVLTKLLNKVFSTGVYPKQWSDGMIVPIFKGKGDKDNANNYRGITLINIMSKIFSHVILN